MQVMLIHAENDSSKGVQPVSLVSTLCTCTFDYALLQATSSLGTKTSFWINAVVQIFHKVAANTASLQLPVASDVSATEQNKSSNIVIILMKRRYIEKDFKEILKVYSNNSIFFFIQNFHKLHFKHSISSKAKM